MEKNNIPEHKEDKNKDNISNSTDQPTDNKMAQNPNPRANENIKNTPFEREVSGSNSVGSEITDGEGG